MNLPNQVDLFSLVGDFCILNFSPPRFAYFAFSLFIGSSLFCVYLKASSPNVNFVRASHGEQLGKSYTWCTVSLSKKVIQLMRLILRSCEYGSQIKKLFIACGEIGEKL